MTRNQIEYQNLQQTKLRDARNYALGLQTLEVNRSTLDESKRHNTVVEMETNRHNLVVEDQALKDLGIKMYNAESGRIQAHASTAQAGAALTQASAALMNAQTNAVRMEHDYEIGLRDVAVKEGNLSVSQQKESHEYEVAKGNLSVNQSNAESNAVRAEADKSRAATELLKYYLQSDKVKAEISLAEADRLYKQISTEYTKNRAAREYIDGFFGGLNQLFDILGFKNAQNVGRSFISLLE